MLDTLIWRTYAVLTNKGRAAKHLQCRECSSTLPRFHP